MDHLPGPGRAQGLRDAESVGGAAGAALSGIWLTVIHPAVPPDGTALYVMRVVTAGSL